MLTVHSEIDRPHRDAGPEAGRSASVHARRGRVEAVVERIRAAGLGEIVAPRDYPIAAYARVHGERYLRFLERAWSDWTALGRARDARPLCWPVRDLRCDVEPNHIDGRLGFYSMSADAPIAADTWRAARASADLALTGADALGAGARGAFALCRSPGHHAAAEYMGGRCYLNNAAIAARQLLENGARRAVVLDVDYRHGNGTQSIFYDRADVFFISLHGDPAETYPYFAGHRDERGEGAGEGFNLNYPLPRAAVWSDYEAALTDACKRIENYRPDVLVVSLGAAVLAADLPSARAGRRRGDYRRVGAAIAALGRPTLFVMEDGASGDASGANVVNLLTGYDDA